MIACPECGEIFKQIGNHWTKGSCSHPSMTKHQHEIVTGVLMGDGTIDRQKGWNPCLTVNITVPEYLEYLDEVFGILSTGVRIHQTAEQSYRNGGKFGENTTVDDYSDIYRLRTRRLPELQEYASWYDTGKKVWPKSVELTPTVLKHWYCCDGTWQNSTDSRRIDLALSNEMSNTQKVNNMFERSGLPTPSNYATSDRGNGTNSCNAQFTVAASEELLEYMGEPLPGFEYKWPERFNTIESKHRGR